MEENKINIDELVNEYTALTSEKLKESYLKSKVKVVPYLSYATKIVLADEIVKQSYLDKNGFIYVDSCKNYLLYMYTLLSNYTNLNLDPSKMVDQYDLLDSNGLIELLKNMIPENEVATFKTIINMKRDDIITNNYEIHAFISNRLKELYPNVAKKIEPVIVKLSDKLDSLDEKKIEKIMDKAMRIIK